MRRNSGAHCNGCMCFVNLSDDSEAPSCLAAMFDVLLPFLRAITTFTLR